MIDWRGVGKSLLTMTGASEKRLMRKMERCGNRLAVLFHRVLPESLGNDDSPPGMVMSVDSFRRTLDLLMSRFEVVSPDTFLDSYPRELDKPSVLVTFDDGWQDVVENALPEMSRRGVKGICFVTPAFVEGGGIFWPERLIRVARLVEAPQFAELAGCSPPAMGDTDGLETLMGEWKSLEREERESTLRRLEELAGGHPPTGKIAGWDSLRVLQAGGVEIGSHGYSHELLTELDEDAAFEEIELSREMIGDRLGSVPRVLAYPNGDSNRKVRELVRRSGYQFAFSLRGDPANRYHLPRINLHDGPARDAKNLIWAVGSE